MLIYKNDKFYHGQNVMVELKGQKFEGKISIKNSQSFYICSDVEFFNGDSCYDKLGYMYSWIVEINNAGNCSETDLSLYADFIDRKDDIKISLNLTWFCKTLDLPNLLTYKIGVMIDCTSIIDSDEKGFVEMIINGKKINIKLCRLYRKLIIAYNNKINENKFKYSTEIELTDVLIESIHNKYVSFKSDYSYKILKGEDILKGYTGSNYGESDSGRKIDSCMTNKLSFLNLYTKNPETISLLALYKEEKIYGRCLIWNINGVNYYDRQYYTDDTTREYIRGVLTSNMYIPILTNSNISFSVDIENAEFNDYPYMDTFKYINITTKTVSSIVDNMEYVLDDTTGRRSRLPR